MKSIFSCLLLGFAVLSLSVPAAAHAPQTQGAQPAPALTTEQMYQLACRPNSDPAVAALVVDAGNRDLRGILTSLITDPSALIADFEQREPVAGAMIINALCMVASAIEPNVAATGCQTPSGAATDYSRAKTACDSRRGR